MSNATLKSKACSTKKAAKTEVTVGAMTNPTGCMVPQCEIRIEECQDGCKIYCTCDDQVACKTLQNLCRALAGGLCSVCCTWNGTMICQCNLACCHCTCEMMADGICVCCKTDDKACVKMVQAICRCLCCCQDCGCTCTVCFGETPVCQSACC